jgi:PEP-CTERM motif
VINREEAMIEINHHDSVRRLLFATALPFGLLATGAMPGHAGTVTVTGANGSNGVPGRPAGAGGPATATTTTPSDPSNSATATGGNGGSGSFAGLPGGGGGAANSTATTSIKSGASAEAASFGGGGSFGEGGHPPGAGGDGGAASSHAAASSTTGSASAIASSTGGARGIGRILSPGGGSAAAAGTASSATGSASATAASAGGAGLGAPSGSATASANARNAGGAALTSAFAPAGSFAKALTNATVATDGSGSAPGATIVAGEAASDAILTPNISTIGAGAMSAAYGGIGQALEYEASAIFDFTPPQSESFELDLESYSPSGIGFGLLDFSVTVGKVNHSYSFSSLSSAESFFKAHVLDLGTLAGSQSIQLAYSLDYADASAKAGGFGYRLVDGPSAAIPEPSTWTMMFIGFTGLAWVGRRASRRAVAGAV